MIRAFVLATALALASAGAATAQDAGRSNLESAEAAYDRGDYAEAVRWYRMAADQGNATAQTILGSMYGNTFRDVQVVPQNYAEAVRWYRMAADQGNSQGQLSLGHRYLHGEGVPTNYVEAYKWFALSAAQGNVFASTPRDFVLEKMTPAQIAEGQRLVAAWRPS